MPQRTLSESEFNAIRDRLLSEAPDNLSESDFHNWIRPRLAAAVGEAESSPAKPEGSALGRAASGAWSMLNPVEMVKGAAHAIAHPIDTGSALISAQAGEFSKAIEAAKRGEWGYLEAIGHAAAGALPVLGPVAARVGEQIGEGDIAGGVGAAGGLVGGVLLPAAAAKGAKSVTARIPFGAGRTAEEIAAIEAGQAAGVPMDAATATGNRAIGAIQHMADRSLGGSLIAEKAAEAQARGLATMGEQLAAKGHAAPVTTEQAGQAVRDAVRGKIRTHAGEADTAYGTLRDIEADPANLREVEMSPAPGTSAAAEGRLTPAARGRFAGVGASTEDLWQGVLGDARRNGFTGSADDLKVEFAERLRQARSLGDEIKGAQGEVGDRALLAEIRKMGGLRSWESKVEGQTRYRDYGEMKTLSEAFDRNFGHKGGGSIFRDNGLGFDQIAQQLSEDPKWASAIPDDRALYERLNTIARQGRKAVGEDFEHLLRASGVEPGAQWWKGTGAQNVQTMALPVDLRVAKESLTPLYQSLKRESELVPLMGDKARALTALDRLLNGPDHAPLSTVDAALGELKTFARSDVPELRSAGQGAAAQAVKQLDEWVKLTAENAGPEAVAALEQGRAATVAKYQAAGVLETLSDEGVKTFQKLTARGDSAIGDLRRVAQQAPGELPKIGRAYLDQLLEKATADGGFAHGPVIANEWQKLGAETKRLLFKTPGHVDELDKFFRLARMTAKNANPSGTAHALAAASAVQGGSVIAVLTGALDPITGVAALVGPPAVSKFLHSPAGVRILTKGFSVPLGSKAARTAWAAQVTGQAQRMGLTSPSGSQPQPVGAQ